jgi:hypothetical protein
MTPIFQKQGNKMKKLIKPFVVSGVSCVAILFSMWGISGCSQKTLNNIVPYLPPVYYGSTLIMPFDLANAYWSPYITRREAESNYNGQIYVFKDFKVTKQTLSTENKGYIWVDLVKAYPLSPANIKQLSVGEKIDVVGVLAGPCKDFPNTLTFSDCVFLPAGCVKLPLGDSTQFQYTPTY